MMDLDNRQRAMLAEMGAPVWWPQSLPPEEMPPLPVAAVVAAAAEAPAAVAPAPAPVRAPQAPQALTAEFAAQAIVAAAGGGRVADRLGAAPQRAPAVPLSGPVATLNWAELQTAVSQCEACSLCKTRKNTVFGVGPAPVAEGQPPHADWLIVGEAPGENEDLQGEPFVGQAGRLLDNMLKALGVSRQGVDGKPQHAACVVNVLKCRPPGNRNPSPEEVALCSPFLRRQVELLQPKVILAMGRFAVQALLAESVTDVQSAPLGRLRGTPYRYHGVPVVVTYHPAYLLRNLPDKAKAWADLCLAQRVWREGLPG
ncbi:uracil-DNA glycosylase [Variovorax sp. HJSM1_2]